MTAFARSRFVTIRAPSGVLRVEDVGRIRRIHVDGKAIVDGRLVVQKKPLPTRLQIETIARLVAVKGDWWLDEMDRRADVNYIRKRLEGIVQPFGGFVGKRILDIGSGSGSSALTMLDAGAVSVMGVEPDPRFVDLARRRARDEGMDDRATFRQISDTRSLPFRGGAFDLITFNAVIEHLPPELRTPILREAYRCLRPGGLLIITETPNRAFPYDNHTTRLPFIPWMPLKWSVPLAHRFSRVAKRGMSKREYISAGIVGGSYWQVKRALPDALCLDLLGSASGRICSRRPCSSLTYFGMRVTERLLNVFRIPLTAVLPSLDLAFMKPAPPLKIPPNPYR